MPGLPWDVGTPPGMTAVRAPLQAIITSIAVSDGDQVAAGDQLMVLESMKMEHEVRATRSGVVHAVAVPVGATVDAGVTLLLLAESGDEGTDASAGPSIPPGHIRADLAEVLERHRMGLDAGRPEVVERRRAQLGDQVAQRRHGGGAGRVLALAAMQSWAVQFDVAKQRAEYHRVAAFAASLAAADRARVMSPRPRHGLDFDRSVLDRGE